MNLITNEMVMQKLAFNPPRFVGYGRNPKQVHSNTAGRAVTLDGKGEGADVAGFRFGVSGGSVRDIPSPSAKPAPPAYTERYTLASGRPFLQKNTITSQGQADAIVAREKNWADRMPGSGNTLALGAGMSNSGSSSSSKRQTFPQFAAGITNRLKPGR